MTQGHTMPTTLPSQWFLALARLYAYHWNGRIEYIETTAYGIYTMPWMDGVYAFRIGEHLKTRLNVLDPGCAQLDNLWFVMVCSYQP
jgi:hypothetical protein